MGNVLSMLEATDPRRAGGKAAALARLAEAGFDVPPFVVVPPEAEASGVDALRGELEAALRSIGTDATLYAVRSSGVDEDGADHSFAGQFESYLHIAPADVPECVVKVWASGRSERVAAYRQEHGIGSAPVAPAVLIQRQIRADVAGVAFSADPVSGRRSVAVVSSVWGLGTQLVGGEADADTFRVDRDGAIIEHKIAHKTLAHRPDPTPVSPEDADRPSLTDDQIRAVADLARRAAMHFGRPQDIEWAIENGRLYLLQSRPITTLATLADPDGVLRLWDNSNIAESYGGITTPLTFSFARHAYAGVYREFCRVMGVPKSIIAANDVMFDHMLGLLRGRVYYNLLNWYRLIAMLPGFSVNRAFMEQMMGTRHALPEDLVQKIADEFRVGKLRDSLRLVRTGLGLIVGHLRLPRTIRDFYRRLAESLRLAGMPAGETSTEAISAALGRMRIDELTEEFRKLEAKLLRRWDAPIVNDFLAMIFFGVLGKLCEKWLGKPGMHNELIREGGEIISAEPAQRISAMAEVAAKDSALVDRLCDAEVRDALRAIEAHAELSKQYHAYMDKFGDRCLEELKLESPTLVDDPAPLLRAIGHAARRRLSGADAAPRESAGRHPAEEAARAALRGKPLRRTVFRWVLKHARARVRDRENLRFERTRLFGRVRRIFVEVGRRLWADGKLHEPRDIFYLELGEILGFVEGTATTTDLAELASLRKRQFERYHAEPAPADRFETRGAVNLGNAMQAPASAGDASSDGADLRGLPCCGGVVRGRVRVIRDPRGARLEQDEILVAERTDPGWIMLFPAAAGVLVERGSLLSHAAIVARELGIPAIVSIPDLTRRLVDGQAVEMDAAAGVVRIIE